MKKHNSIEDYLKQFTAPETKSLDKKFYGQLQATEMPIKGNSNTTFITFLTSAAILLLAGFIHLHFSDKPHPTSHKTNTMQSSQEILSGCKYIGGSFNTAIVQEIHNGVSRTNELYIGSIFRGLKLVIITKHQLVFENDVHARFFLEKVT